MRETSKEKKVSETVPEKQAIISKLKSSRKSILGRGTAPSYHIPTYVKTLQARPFLGTEGVHCAWNTEVVRNESGEVDMGVPGGHVVLAKD